MNRRSLKQAIKQQFRRFIRYQHAYNPFSPAGDREFNRLRLLMLRFARAHRHRDVFFVQIGAHDGAWGDPIHHARGTQDWHGILVEPVPSYFARLQEKKKAFKNLILENVAIAERDERRLFYTMKPEITERYPYWTSMLNTFRKEVILSNKSTVPDIENYIEEQEIEAITFQTLMDKNNVSAFDLLLIDTEGYDYEILKQVDFARYKPSLVVYETINLGEDEKEAAEALMRLAGYKVRRMFDNNIATL